MDKVAIAIMIKEARLQAGITQTQLADKLGMHRASLSRIESGKHDTDVSTLRKIAIALSCDLEILLKPKK